MARRQNFLPHLGFGIKPVADDHFGGEDDDRKMCIRDRGLYGTILSILLMIIAKDLMVLFIARVLAGISFSVTSAANYAAASDLAPEDNKALGIGWFQNMATFASYIGPAVGVWGLNRYLATGSWSAFYVVTLLTAVYSLVLNFFIRYENKPEWKAKMAAAAEARKNKQAVLEDGPVLPPMKPFLGMTAVSYTHLDVYKRQGRLLPHGEGRVKITVFILRLHQSEKS